MAFAGVLSHVDARLVLACNNVNEITERLLQAIIEKNGMQKHVVRVGVVKDIFGEILAQSRAIALPYRDTPSLKLLESMSVGRAVVTTGLGWAPELISNGDNGFIIGVGHVRDLTRKLLELLKNPELARAMGRNAQKTIQEKCDPLQHVGRLVKAFRFS
jgi:glycosyltransferase involved in cell wall biosynthesis